MEVELEAGQEEHEGEPEERQHLDRLVHLGPAEHVRSDQDAEEDLDDGHGYPHGADAVDDERGGEGGDGDHREAVEGDVTHAGAPVPYLRRTRSATRPVHPVWCDAPSPAPVLPWKYS